LVTDDIHWQDPAMRGHEVHNRAAFRAFTERFFLAFPDVQIDAIGSVYLALDGSGIAVATRMTGSFTGELAPWGDGPTIDPTGRHFDISALELYEFREGLVSRWVIAYDLFDLSQQIGVFG
jgi:predicted ester cyclase